jgi:acyl-CoA synthetase (AMP-forming)/AMP-acid ligase II
MILHYACASVGACVLNLNTHLVSRELSHVLRDSGAACVFARRDPHAGILSDVLSETVGDEEEPPTCRMKVNVALREIVWVPSSSSESAAAATDGRSFSGATLREWPRTRRGRPRSESFSVPMVTDDDERETAGQNAHMYYTSGTTGNPKGT